MRGHDTATEKRYRELLAQQAREGLTREETAARAGIKPSTLTWWRSELKRLDRERSRAESGGATLVPVTIREVAPMSAPVRPASPSAYEVRVNSPAETWVIHIPRGIGLPLRSAFCPMVDVFEVGGCGTSTRSWSGRSRAQLES